MTSAERGTFKEPGYLRAHRELIPIVEKYNVIPVSSGFTPHFNGDLRQRTTYATERVLGNLKQQKRNYSLVSTSIIAGDLTEETRIALNDAYGRSFGQDDKRPARALTGYPTEDSSFNLAMINGFAAPTESITYHNFEGAQGPYTRVVEVKGEKDSLFFVAGQGPDVDEGSPKGIGDQMVDAMNDVRGLLAQVNLGIEDLVYGIVYVKKGERGELDDINAINKMYYEQNQNGDKPLPPLHFVFVDGLPSTMGLMYQPVAKGPSTSPQ